MEKNKREGNGISWRLDYDQWHVVMRCMERPLSLNVEECQEQFDLLQELASLLGVPNPNDP